VTPDSLISSEGYGYETLVGLDGWLFIWGVNALSAQVTGRVMWSAADEELVATTYSQRLAFCEALGARYLQVVVPDKSTIYFDKLPPSVVRASRTIIEQNADLLSSRSEGSSFLDLTACISRRRREGEKVFHQTDSHWTYPMALLACNEIIAASGLRDQLPLIDPEALSWRRRKRIFELSALMPEPFPEEFDMQTLGEPQSRCVYENHARGRGKVQVYEGGKGTAKVVLFRDSFSSMFLAPLAECCSRLVAVNSARTFHKALVAAEKPDLVIFQTSERFLYPAGSDEGQARLDEYVVLQDIAAARYLSVAGAGQ